MGKELNILIFLVALSVATVVPIFLPSPFGFPSRSCFLKFAIFCMRLNFRLEASTIWRTGPVFFKQVFLEFNDSNVQLIDWEFVGTRRDDSVMFDIAGDSNWTDGVEVAETKGRHGGVRRNEDLVARFTPWWRMEL